jgi:LacI family transcriptional regulator
MLHRAAGLAVIGEFRIMRAMNNGQGQPNVATLRDVAALAGVSVSTASRALTGRRRVSAATVERVHASAHALGYSPNEAARLLKMSRSMTLGVTFLNLATPVVLDVIDGLTAGSHERDFSLLVTSARGDPAIYRRHIQRFFERRVDGLFLVSPSHVEADLAPFRRAGAPVLALVGRGPECGDVPLLTVREQPVADAAVARLAELGHRALAFLAPSTPLALHRRGVLTAAAARRGLPLHYVSIKPDDDASSMQRALAPVLGKLGGATALLADHREMASLLPALRALELRIPDDLSLIAFTDSRWTEGVVWPPIASIHTDTFEMGRRAAHLLARWLEGEAPPDRTLLDLARWVERPSVGRSPV